MEDCGGGDVGELLLHVGHSTGAERCKPPLGVRMHLAYQAALGCQHIHNKGLIHRCGPTQLS